MKDKWCNLCGYETKQDEDGCVWHQRVKTDADGVKYLKYDEFNQDGEERAERRTVGVIEGAVVEADGVGDALVHGDAAEGAHL